MNYGNYQPVYPQFQQPNNFPQNNFQPAANVMRFVASKVEALSAQIPFDGSTTYFFDTSNGKIYAKTFDSNTGCAPLATYAKEIEQPIQYATLEDINALRAEIEALRKAGANE